MHISLEVVGGIAIIAGLGWLVLWATFRNFSGGNCDDAEQQIIPSPGGKHTVKSFHRVCGAGNERPYSFYFVYLSTGNPNAGYEYTPIVELKNVALGRVSVAWDGPDQLSVTYPESSEVVDAYAKTFDVRVVLHPALPETGGGAK